MDDTGQNLQESPDTLVAQQKALLAGRQVAQMFPKGTKPLAVPAGMAIVTTPRGTFHYNPKLTDGETIKTLSAEGKENEILGLGDLSKDDVEASGESPLVVVERDPAGTEVKAALTVPSKMKSTIGALSSRKDPKNVIKVETTEKALATRVGADGVASDDEFEAIEAPSASPATVATPQVAKDDEFEPVASDDDFVSLRPDGKVDHRAELKRLEDQMSNENLTEDEYRRLRDKHVDAYAALLKDRGILSRIGDYVTGDKTDQGLVEGLLGTSMTLANAIKGAGKFVKRTLIDAPFEAGKQAGEEVAGAVLDPTKDAADVASTMGKQALAVPAGVATGVLGDVASLGANVGSTLATEGLNVASKYVEDRGNAPLADVLNKAAGESETLRLEGNRKYAKIADEIAERTNRGAFETSRTIGGLVAPAKVAPEMAGFNAAVTEQALNAGRKIAGGALRVIGKTGGPITEAAAATGAVMAHPIAGSGAVLSRVLSAAGIDVPVVGKFTNGLNEAKRALFSSVDDVGEAMMATPKGQSFIQRVAMAGDEIVETAGRELAQAEEALRQLKAQPTSGTTRGAPMKAAQEAVRDAEINLRKAQFGTATAKALYKAGLDGTISRTAANMFLNTVEGAAIGGTISGVMGEPGNPDVSEGAGIGGLFGAVVAGLGAPHEASQARANTAREFHAERAPKSYGDIPDLDLAHSKTEANLEPSDAKNLASLRGQLAPTGVQVYQVDPATFKKYTGKDNQVGANTQIDTPTGPKNVILLNDRYSQAKLGQEGHETLHAVMRTLPEPAQKALMGEILKNTTKEQRQAAADSYNKEFGEKIHNADTIVEELAADLAGNLYTRNGGFGELSLPKTIWGRLGDKIDAIGARLAGNPDVKTALGFEVSSEAAKSVESGLNNYFQGKLPKNPVETMAERNTRLSEEGLYKAPEVDFTSDTATKVEQPAPKSPIEAVAAPVAKEKSLIDLYDEAQITPKKAPLAEVPVKKAEAVVEEKISQGAKPEEIWKAVDEALKTGDASKLDDVLPEKQTTWKEAAEASQPPQKPATASEEVQPEVASNEGSPAVAPLVDGEITKADEAVLVKPKGKKLRFAYRPDGVVDIIEAIQELGGVPRPGKNPGGEFDGFSEAFRGPARLLIGQGRGGFDAFMQDLAASYPEFAHMETWGASEVGDAIKSALTQRRQFKQAMARDKNSQVFLEAALTGKGQKKSQPLTVDSLVPGDEFKVKREPFVVKEIDAAEGTVTVKDGDRFGTQKLPLDGELHPDAGTYKENPSEPNFMPAPKENPIKVLNVGTKRFPRMQAALPSKLFVELNKASDGPIDLSLPKLDGYESASAKKVGGKIVIDAVKADGSVEQLTAFENLTPKERADRAKEAQEKYMDENMLTPAGYSAVDAAALKSAADQLEQGGPGAGSTVQVPGTKYLISKYSLPMVKEFLAKAQPSAKTDFMPASKAIKEKLAETLPYPKYKKYSSNGMTDTATVKDIVDQVKRLVVNHINPEENYYGKDAGDPAAHELFNSNPELLNVSTGQDTQTRGTVLEMAAANNPAFLKALDPAAVKTAFQEATKKPADLQRFVDKLAKDIYSAGNIKDLPEYMRTFEILTTPTKTGAAGRDSSILDNINYNEEWMPRTIRGWDPSKAENYQLHFEDVARHNKIAEWNKEPSKADNVPLEEIKAAISEQDGSLGDYAREVLGKIVKAKIASKQMK